MINDVLRAKTLQFGKIYKKFIDPDIELENIDMSSGDLCKAFNFESKDAFNEFLYKDYAYEVFAEAPVVEKMLDKKLNLWHLALTDNDDFDEPFEFIIASEKEFNFSIGYTCFFLARAATHVREIYFPKDSNDIWDKCDVLITANRDMLENKPEGKKTVKISMEYNDECSADFEYESLSALLDDGNFLKKIKGVEFDENEEEVNEDGND